jgi:PPOX class probable F420-dependent enzyme
MDGTEARRRFAAARVAVLSTVDSSGAPHLVPITFALTEAVTEAVTDAAGSTIFSAVDGKPKRATRLRRHANIEAEPRVSLLVQHWDEDWSLLWWVRADGRATVSDESATVGRAIGLLRAKYEQYVEVDVHGPIIEIAVERWYSWP